MRTAGRALVLLFAVLNCLLYSCLLPLWEGFDEPFHYGYVQNLSTGRGLPVFGRSPVSREIAESLTSVPISFILKRSIPNTFAFEDWFSLPRADKARLRAKVDAIPREQRSLPSALLNYEAQQAPLAYILVAPLDILFANLGLSTRILFERVLISIAATFLLWLGCYRLSDELKVNEPYRSLSLALFFEAQIVMAAVAHIANDWLAITAAVWFFATMARLLRRPEMRTAFVLGTITSIGLLAKAYFLAFVPVYVLVLLFAKIRLRLSTKAVIAALLTTLLLAGPWYVRNLRVYGNLSGMQEDVRGVARRDLLVAFTHINWWRSFVESARWSLWTGNESHLAFSQATLNLELLLFVSGLALLVIRWRRLTSTEAWVAAGVIVFASALAYDLCVTWVDTRGLQTTTGSYYSPCILPEVAAFVCLGFQQSGLLGRILAALTGLLAAWISALTYIAKLIPYYGGLVGRSTFPALWKWWTHQLQSSLFATPLSPVPIIMLFCACTLVSLAVLTTFLVLQVSGACSPRQV